MLDEIATTEEGAKAVAFIRKKRIWNWKIRYGKPPKGSGAFTYPTRLIVIGDEYSYGQSEAMLAHELGHAYLYRGSPAASHEQEYEVEAFAKPIQRELGLILDAEYDAWARKSREEHYEAGRSHSLWHDAWLPYEQPDGVEALAVSTGQGAFIWMTGVKKEDVRPCSNSSVAMGGEIPRGFFLFQ